MKHRSAILISTSNSCMATVAEGVIDPTPPPTLYTLTCMICILFKHANCRPIMNAVSVSG